MKSDRIGIGRICLLALGSALLLFSGCVTGGGGDDSAVINEPPRGPAEHTGDTKPVTDEPREFGPTVRHMPETAHPDRVWRIPEPVAAEELNVSRLVARPDSPTLTTLEFPTVPQPRQESPQELEILTPVVPAVFPDALEVELPHPAIVHARDREQGSPEDRIDDEPAVGPDRTASGDPTTAHEPAPSSESGPAAEPGAASQPAPAAEPGTATAPAPEPAPVPEDSRADRTVDPGESFEIALPGLSWVYLGGGGQFDFMGRTIDGDETVFSFGGSDSSGVAPGTLLFESQNLITGDRFQHEERVRVVTPETSEDATESDQSNGTSQPSASSTGSSRSAAGGAAAQAPGDTATDLSQLSEMSGEELLGRVDQLHNSQDYETVRALLEEMRHTGAGAQDEVLFRLARVYETQWEGRDLRAARELYQLVVDDHPLSRRREHARERIEYINRHFFHIR